MLEWTGERFLPFIDPSICGPEIHYEHLHRYAFASQYVAGKKVLDLACGEGYGSLFLSKTAECVVGIDINTDTIQHASKKYEGKNLKFKVGSILNVPIQGSKIFDIIICFEAIEHIKEHSQLFSEISRLLKEDGILILSTPNKKLYSDDVKYKNPFHEKELYYEELENHIKIYFSDIHFLGQQTISGSSIFLLQSRGLDSSSEFIINKKNDEFEFINKEDKKPIYFIVLASKNTLDSSVIKNSYLIDASNTQISLLNNKIANVIQDRVNIENQIQELSNKVSSLHNEVSAKDTQLLDLSNKVSSLHNEVSAKDTQILDLSNKVSSLHNEVSAKDTQILDLSQMQLFSEQYQKSLLSQIQDKNLGIVSRDSEIVQLKNTISYQCTMKFHHNVIELIFPQNTRRREIYDLGLKSGRILISEGFSKLLWYYNERKHTKIKEREIRKIVDQRNIQILTEKKVSLTNYHEITFPETQNEVDFSIIIPVYGKLQYTINCLKSISQKTKGMYEVIIVDDASTDESINFLKDIKNLTIIRNQENLGFVESCNRGAKSSRGKYLLFLNNDTEVTENWATALIDPIKNENVGAVGAKLVYPDGKLQEAGGIIWNDASGCNYGRGENPDNPEYNYIRDVDYCSGAALLVRRDIFAKLNGFDTCFKPAYYEDTDLCFAIRNLGYRILYQPLSVIIHHEGISSGTDITKGMKRYQEINKQKFFEKWHDTLKENHFSPDPTNLLIAKSRKMGKSILVIDHNIPTYDKDSGSYRMYNILKILSELNRNVTFISENLLKIEPYTTTLQQNGINVLYYPFIQSIESHLQENGSTYDVVILSRAHIAIKYFSFVRRYCPKAKIVFDTVDLQFLRLSRQSKIEENTDLLKEANSIKITEIGLARMANSTWVVSPVEQELLLKEEPSLHVDIVSNIHEIHRSNKKFSERHDLLFIGGFSHPPNIDAMKWFVSKIFLLIKEEIPGMKLYILGSNPPDEVLFLNSNDVIVTGYISDVSQYFENCRLFVAPLRYGAGVKGKINQSMSYGLPVITTNIGAEGMGLIDGESVIIADTAEHFAQRCIDTYNNEKLWIELSNKSIINVQEKYSTAVWKEKISRIIDDLFIDEITYKMKKEWNERGKADYKYFISYSNSEEEFFHSGKESFDQFILPIMDDITCDRDPKELKVLEIGCGAGRVTFWMANVFGDVYGVDIAEEMIGRGKKYCKDLKNVHLSVNNGMDLSDFNTGYFDFVFSFVVFQHIPDKNIIINYIKEVRRVIKPGCIFKFQVQGYQGKDYADREKDSWYGASFSEDEINEIAQRFDFEVLHLDGQGTQYFWIIFRRI